VACNDCHQGNYTSGATPTNCTSCHNSDYVSAVNPNHVWLNIPADCAACHSTASGWVPATFALHDNFYPLTGAHATLANDCVACHHGDYNNTPNTCAGCHTDDYIATTDPNHVTQQFPTNCTDCHGQTAWAPSTLDHSFYPVVGAHTSVSCNDCHQGNYTSGATPTNCAGCHTDDYNATTDPNHAAQQFPTSCADCHGQTTWAPSTFDHSAVWPLTGAHTTVACNDCHQGNYTSGATPTNCTSCHNSDYVSAVNPNHVWLNIPADCSACHSTAPGWAPATFALHDNFYPLTGAHATMANDCVGMPPWRLQQYTQYMRRLPYR
jgi:mono/diheme cytochrome c family protein